MINARLDRLLEEGRLTMVRGNWDLNTSVLSMACVRFVAVPA